MMENNNGVLKKRVLTWKSCLGFGKYTDNTINQIFSQRGGESYLRWVYFKYSRIDFMPDILEKIRIPKELILQKPSQNFTDHEIRIFQNKCLSHIKLTFDKDIFLSTFHDRSAFNKNTIRKSLIIDRLKYNKKQLQIRNQGV